MICDTREDPERERRLLENAIAQRVDGVILGPTNAGWENTALLRKMNIPYVVIGREIAPRRDGERNDSYFAGDDSYQAGFLAGQCLAQNGHRRIGVVEWNGRVSSAVERDLGFYDAVREQVKLGGGMEVESSSDLSMEEGYRMTKELLRRAKPTALFSAITGMRRAACAIWQTRAIPSRTIFPLSWWARPCGQIYPARSITEYTSMRNGWAPRQGVFWWRRYGARQARFCAKSAMCARALCWRAPA